MTERQWLEQVFENLNKKLDDHKGMIEKLFDKIDRHETRISKIETTVMILPVAVACIGGFATIVYGLFKVFA